MKNNTFFRGMFLVIALLITLCFSVYAGGDSETVDEGPPKIALIMKSLANEFFLTMENGAKEHETNSNGQYELIANGIKDESAVAKQIEIVEQMIALEVSAIIIAPAD